MSWGAWLVPELRDSQEFGLRALELELRDTIKEKPEEVIRLCVSLSRLTAMQEAIILKATKRIAELEVGQAIAAPTPRRRRWWRQIPGWRWLRRWLDLFRSVVRGQ